MCPLSTQTANNLIEQGKSEATPNITGEHDLHSEPDKEGC